GLDEVYAPIRSIILTTDPIPDVKGAFATLSRDESHMSTQSHNVSRIGNGNSAFVARTNTRSNNWSNSNNNHNKRLNRPILLYTHCNMNGHTADRCFELVEYPPNFKKRNGSNQSGSSNAAIPGTKDQSFISSNTFTDEQFKRLMALISEKSGSASILTNVADDPYDDGRDKESEIIEGIYPISSEGTKNIGDTRRDEGEHPDDSAPAEAVSDIENMRHMRLMIMNLRVMTVIIRRLMICFNLLMIFQTDRIVLILEGLLGKLLSHENYSFSTSINKLCEPKTYNEALSDIRWVEAMNLEMEALNRNNTWVITKLPYGRKAIGSKWVFKVKYKSTGDVEMFKARLLAKGFNQKEGTDYEETFSPIVKTIAVRYVYMSLPEGYFDQSDKRVCKLVKSLYGLKQAPRKWNEKLTSVLIKNGFVQRNDLNEINKVKEFLKSKFMIKDLGKLKYFLGIEVLESGGSLILTQRKYCLELLSEFDWAKCKVTRKSVTGAMNSVTYEVIWIMKILNELNVKVSLPATINCDNSSAIQIVANLVFHERTKYFKIELFFLKEKVAVSIVKTVKVKYEDNLADVFTKCLSVVEHNKFYKLLKLKDLYHN
ncbi:ribonuclease H-like domain-containing protein, partial [Tanacetum coccineum]